LRIIAGEKRGTKIVAPKGHDTRPTADRVREAAFNLIGPVDGATVLDLFAGSAVFADDDRAACAAIGQNLEKLRLAGATVLCRDAMLVLSEEVRAGRLYDLVLVDPPYRMFSTVQTGLAVYLPQVLAEDGLAVIETHAKEEPELPLAERASRRYGSARLTLFEHR
jgi:16S rRNA (guanine966-N2)-methyltransferase